MTTVEFAQDRYPPLELLVKLIQNRSRTGSGCFMNFVANILLVDCKPHHYVHPNETEKYSAAKTEIEMGT